MKPAQKDESTEKTAVIYLRVSTKEQAERNGDPEGYSIPAQREACRRRAQTLEAAIVREFVDRGESAKTADRPALKEMLQYVAQHRIGYVIVHKIDRLARNRADDLAISSVFHEAGAQLVSCSENIDRTPSGLLLHGIMASIAEFYSQNLAAEVKKGMTQKAKNGGTPALAPIGYLNVRPLVDGREVRTVEVDPIRGPLIAWAFEAYASGEYSLRKLADELERRGLTQRETRNQAERPLPANKLHHVLTNKYYVGIILYGGEQYEGKHEPLIDPFTFEAVQQKLDTRRRTGDRAYRRFHYLKGSLRCGRCKSKLGYCISEGNGGKYEYFFCWGRHERRTSCDLPHLTIDSVEVAVHDYHYFDRLDPEHLEETRLMLREEIQGAAKTLDKEVKRLTAKISGIQQQRLKASDMVLSEAIPEDIGRAKQLDLGIRLAEAETELAEVKRRGGASGLDVDRVFEMVLKCAESYTDSAAELRREWNLARFLALDIDVDDGEVVVSGGDRTPLFEAIHTAQIPASRRSHRGRKPSNLPEVTSVLDGSRISLLVETMGLEPTTPCLQSRCSSQLSYVPAGWQGYADPAPLGIHGSAVPVRRARPVDRRAGIGAAGAFRSCT